MPKSLPAEPLAESAGLARRWARTLCRTDPLTGERCDWNHGLWQILRLLELNATPADQPALCREALRALQTGSDGTRVLVSGSADYGMLHQVLAAWSDRDRAPDVTVVDICETPLALNRWYAERVGASIATRCSDMLEYDEPLPFDAVCTHSFLGQFAPDARAQLIEKWHALLRPGGIAVTVNRIRPGTAPGPVAFGAQQAVALRAMIERLAPSLPPAVGVDGATLAADAERYALRQRPHPIASVAEIRALFERGGFEIVQLSCAPVPGGPRHSVRGPTVSAGADYVSVIARRPRS